MDKLHSITTADLDGGSDKEVMVEVEVKEG